MGVAQTMEIPSVFADGYEKARILDPALAHLLEFASLLGVELHRNDREGIMVVWRALVNPSCNFSGSPTSVGRAATTTCRTTSGPIDDNENRGPAGVLHLVMEQGATIAPSGGGHATIYAAAAGT